MSSITNGIISSVLPDTYIRLWFN